MSTMPAALIFSASARISARVVGALSGSSPALRNWLRFTYSSGVEMLALAGNSAPPTE